MPCVTFVTLNVAWLYSAEMFDADWAELYSRTSSRVPLK